MNVKIVSNSKHPLPNYETEYSAGMDLRASIDEPVVIEPFKRVIIPTGLFVELPVGYEGQVRPRSGLALKHGITVLNSPGTIDADYRGEIKVILVNLSDQPFVVNDGERIAQLVVSAHSRVSWIETDQLTSSDRGVGGFGSTGK
ncbi:MAG: dUTP diphosphatase [Sphingobacteriia bacterium]|nr:dUTP diphosphatase [Sphingobacteriia bacterium]